MALGAGKYDDLCTMVREQSGASCAILILMGGVKGDGFSVQSSPQGLLALPALLRHMADQIEADLRT